MAGSTYGTLFTITTWGESHGPALGVVIDGCPAGLPLTPEDIQQYLDRRKPGQSRYTTARKESDQAEILSGVFEGKTTGTPISILVRNQDQRSRDYGNIKDCYRPGHADYPFDMKYGFRDYRGGGRSSGRETIGRVAAGAVAARLLERLGIRLCTYTKAIGPVSVPEEKYDFNAINTNPLYQTVREQGKQAGLTLLELPKGKIPTFTVYNDSGQELKNPKLVIQFTNLMVTGNNLTADSWGGRQINWQLAKNNQGYAGTVTISLSGTIPAKDYFDFPLAGAVANYYASGSPPAVQVTLTADNLEPLTQTYNIKIN